MKPDQELISQRDSTINRNLVRIRELEDQLETKDKRLQDFRLQLLRHKTFITDSNLDEKFATFLKGNF